MFIKVLTHKAILIQYVLVIILDHMTYSSYLFIIPIHVIYQNNTTIFNMNFNIQYIKIRYYNQLHEFMYIL
jgi:hypothetical protein